MSIGRSLNGKNEQTDQNKKTKNPSKARQLKQTNKQTKTIRFTNNDIYNNLTTTTTDLPRWMDSIALLFISIDKLFSNRRWFELHPGSRDRRRRLKIEIEATAVLQQDHQLPLSRNFNRNFNIGKKT